MLGYLPAKFKIRFLPPVPTDDMGDEPWEDKALVQTVAARDPRARSRRSCSTWSRERQRRSGSASERSDARVLDHRACRPTGAAGSRRRSSSDPDVEAIIGVDRSAAEGRARAHRVRRSVADSHALIRRIVEAAEIDTVVDTRLVVDSIVTRRGARTRTTSSAR